MSAASTKCFWYSSMSEAFGANELERFELKISAILFWNVLISALANRYLGDVMGMFRCKGLSTSRKISH